jgi:DNA-binding SARP family transcriptional activator
MKNLLRIRTLGDFYVEINGHLLAPRDFVNRKAASVFKFLCLQPELRAHRDTLLDTFWPALDSFSAAAQLYKCVHFLRKTFESKAPGQSPRDLFRYENELLSLHFSENVELDWQVFCALCSEALEKNDEASLAKAAATYRGDLFPSDTQEEWSHELRKTLKTPLPG